MEGMQGLSGDFLDLVPSSVSTPEPGLISDSFSNFPVTLF
jgi:hypothetical protein